MFGLRLGKQFELATLLELQIRKQTMIISLFNENKQAHLKNYLNDQENIILTLHRYSQLFKTLTSSENIIWHHHMH